jgi:hypothetical protein
VTQLPLPGKRSKRWGGRIPQILENSFPAVCQPLMSSEWLDFRRQTVLLAKL